VFAHWNETERQLVLDVDGSSSAARGDEGEVIERQLACLALCVADTFIINMFTNTVGLRENYRLLNSIVLGQVDIKRETINDD
jgi:hypothetical protein